MNGRFITFEGIEGSGKSTNIAWTAEFLRERDVDVVLTHEPGRTRTGEEIRRVLLHTKDEPLSPMTELFMMFASRTQLLDEVIIPALRGGSWVLCDRFVDSSIAYQGGGRELGVERVSTLVDALGELYVEPDLTFLLDIPARLIPERLAGRALDRFESEDQAFFERIRTTYLECARDSSRFAVIDATQSLDAVKQRIAAVLEPLLSVSVSA